MPNLFYSRIAYSLIGALWTTNEFIRTQKEEEEKGRDINQALLPARLAVLFVSLTAVTLYSFGFIDSPSMLYTRWQIRRARAQTFKKLEEVKASIEFLHEDDLDKQADYLRALMLQAGEAVQSSHGTDKLSRELIEEIKNILTLIGRRKKEIIKERKQAKQLLETQSKNPPVEEESAAEKEKKLKEAQAMAAAAAEATKLAAAKAAEAVRLEKIEYDRKEKQVNLIANQIIEDILVHLGNSHETIEALRIFKKNKGLVTAHIRSNKESLMTMNNGEIAETILNVGGLKEKKYPNIYVKMFEKYPNVEANWLSYTGTSSTSANDYYDQAYDSPPESEYTSESDESEDTDDIQVEAVASTHTKQPVLLVQRNSVKGQSNIVIDANPMLTFLEVKHALLKRCQEIHSLYEKDPGLVRKFIHKHQLSIIRHGLMHVDIHLLPSIEKRTLYYKQILFSLKNIDFNDEAPLKVKTFASNNEIYLEFYNNHRKRQSTQEPDCMYNFEGGMAMIEERFVQLKDKQLSQAVREMLMVEIGEIYQQLSNSTIYTGKLRRDPRWQPAIKLRYEFAHKEEIQEETLKVLTDAMNKELGSSSSSSMRI